LTPPELPGYSIKFPLIFFLAIVFGVVVTGVVFTGEKFHLDRKILEQAQKKYGKEALARLVSWEELIQRDSSVTDSQKLQKVNFFFNKKMMFANDLDLHGVKDYWATPMESLCRGAGDCEDYAIAKYFTLKIMGVAEEKLRIAYVKALHYNMTHMVMLYYNTPAAEPLILDNLMEDIRPASARKDLLPIFTFNGTGLWLAHKRGQGKLAGKSSRLSAWNDLRQKMAEDKL